jgi:hypothetical protein
MEIIQAIFIICTVSFAYLANQIYEGMSEINLEGSASNSQHDEYELKEWEVNALRWVTLTFSITLAVLELMCYSKKIYIKNLVNDLETLKQDIFISKNAVFTANFTMLAVKFILFCINSPPGYNMLIKGRMLGGEFVYTFDGIIMLITLFRLFF